MGYYEGHLVLKSFKPLSLEKGMWFLNKFGHNTRKEEVELYQLDKVPLDQETYIAKNGYPLELYIVDPMSQFEDDRCILASPNEIGWWDDGEDTDELFTVTAKQLNSIFNDYGGLVDIEVAENTEDSLMLLSEEVITPLLYQQLVCIRYCQEEDYIEENQTDNNEDD